MAVRYASPGTKTRAPHQAKNMITALVVAVLAFIIILTLTKDSSFYYAIATALIVGVVTYASTHTWGRKRHRHAK